jgi:hypothetical protein
MRASNVGAGCRDESAIARRDLGRPEAHGAQGRGDIAVERGGGGGVRGRRVGRSGRGGALCRGLLPLGAHEVGAEDPLGTFFEIAMPIRTRHDSPIAAGAVRRPAAAATYWPLVCLIIRT